MENNYYLNGKSLVICDKISKLHKSSENNKQDIESKLTPRKVLPNTKEKNPLWQC